MKGILGISLVLSYLCWSEAAMSLESMQKAGDMMRSVCQPKFKITDEVAFALRTGEFPEDNDVKCYVNCVLEMMNMMKKGKFNHEQSKKQVELMLADEYKVPMLSAMEICKETAKGVKDNCEASYTMMKCISKNNPKFLFA